LAAVDQGLDMQFSQETRGNSSTAKRLSYSPGELKLPFVEQSLLQSSCPVNGHFLLWLGQSGHGKLRQLFKLRRRSFRQIAIETA
jgi:hypothetical protein